MASASTAIPIPSTTSSNSNPPQSRKRPREHSTIGITASVGYSSSAVHQNGHGDSNHSNGSGTSANGGDSTPSSQISQRFSEMLYGNIGANRVEHMVSRIFLLNSS